jgi:hypothetical protein
LFFLLNPVRASQNLLKTSQSSGKSLGFSWNRFGWLKISMAKFKVVRNFVTFFRHFCDAKIFLIEISLLLNLCLLKTIDMVLIFIDPYSHSNKIKVFILFFILNPVRASQNLLKNVTK